MSIDNSIMIAVAAFALIAAGCGDSQGNGNGDGNGSGAFDCESSIGFDEVPEGETKVRMKGAIDLTDTTSGYSRTARNITFSFETEDEGKVAIRLKLTSELENLEPGSQEVLLAKVFRYEGFRVSAGKDDPSWEYRAPEIAITAGQGREDLETGGPVPEFQIDELNTDTTGFKSEVIKGTFCGRVDKRVKYDNEAGAAEYVDVEPVEFEGTIHNN
mgnify:CR=1 FL=1